MEVQIEEAGPLERKLRIEIPTADVDAAFDVVYERLRRKAHLKGFRPGKAPRAVLERYFADEASGDVLDQLVRETLPKAVDEASFSLAVPPKIASAETPRQGAPFTYEARVELRPVIELKQVRGLAVPEVTLPEPEKDPVEQYLQELRVEHATLHPEPQGTTAARGHVAVLDLHAQRDGEEWLHRHEQPILLGEDVVAPGFEENVVGMQEGESREFELELPAPNEPPAEAAEGSEPAAEPAADANGKKIVASFQVQLRKLQRRELPELDDEFAKDVSEECETLEQFRTELRGRVERGREEERQRQREQAALDALIQANDFPVPPTLVEEQLHRRIREVFRGVKMDTESEQFRNLVDSLAERLRPQAERDVRAAFLIREVATSENIQVSDEEVDQHARELAEARGESPKQVLRQTRESELGEAVRQHLLERRVFSFLLEQSVRAGA